jgi:DNA replication protein DnaC
LLTLAGPVGCGKSHLAIAAARQLAAQGESIIYREEPNLIAELQRGLADHICEAVLEEIMVVPWLVIDDLGVTALGDWGKGVIDRIVNARWERSGTKRTLITTNLLDSEMPHRTASRLSDTQLASFMVITASDYRRNRE